MKASAIEFRLRMFINMAIVIVGFFAPWTAILGPGQRMPLLEWLPLELSRLGLLTFTVASPLVECPGRGPCRHWRRPAHLGNGVARARHSPEP